MGPAHPVLDEADGEAGRAAFGDREEEADGLARGRGTVTQVAGGESGGEVDAAEELIVGDGRMDLAAGQGSASRSAT